MNCRLQHLILNILLLQLFVLVEPQDLELEEQEKMASLLGLSVISFKIDKLAVKVHKLLECEQWQDHDATFREILDILKTAHDTNDEATKDEEYKKALAKLYATMVSNPTESVSLDEKGMEIWLNQVLQGSIGSHVLGYTPGLDQQTLAKTEDSVGLGKSSYPFGSFGRNPKTPINPLTGPDESPLPGTPNDDTESVGPDASAPTIPLADSEGPVEPGEPLLSGTPNNDIESVGADESAPAKLLADSEGLVGSGDTEGPVGSGESLSADTINSDSESIGLDGSAPTNLPAGLEEPVEPGEPLLPAPDGSAPTNLAAETQEPVGPGESLSDMESVGPDGGAGNNLLAETEGPVGAGEHLPCPCAEHDSESDGPSEDTLSNIPTETEEPVESGGLSSLGTSSDAVASDGNPLTGTDESAGLGGAPLSECPYKDIGSIDSDANTASTLPTETEELVGPDGSLLPDDQIDGIESIGADDGSSLLDTPNPALGSIELDENAPTNAAEGTDESVAPGEPILPDTDAKAAKPRLYGQFTWHGPHPMFVNERSRPSRSVPWITPTGRPIPSNEAGAVPKTRYAPRPEAQFSDTRIYSVHQPYRYAVPDVRFSQDNQFHNELLQQINTQITTLRARLSELLANPYYNDYYYMLNYIGELLNEADSSTNIKFKRSAVLKAYNHYFDISRLWK